MSNRVDELLAALSNGETAGITPQSRVEAILKALIGGSGIEDLPIPQSVTEAYLYSMAKNGIGSGGGGGGGGGPVSWNDITDKPFGEEHAVIFDTKGEFDMSQATMLPSGMPIFKVSDTVYELSDFVGATIRGTKGTTYILTDNDVQPIYSNQFAAMVQQENDDGMIMFAVFVTDTDDIMDEPVPGPGVYTVYADETVDPSIVNFEFAMSMEGTVAKKLDEKFLPTSAITIDKLNEALGVIEDGTY